MTRSEHLQWCKNRALEYVKGNDLQNAMISMNSDVLKHPDTKHHRKTNTLGLTMFTMGELNTPEKMERWINGYN